MDRHAALVTGAARGIGRQVALTLAEKGYMVAVNDLDTPERILQELEQAGARTLSVPGDVSDEGSVRGMVEAVVGEFGRVDALVNNAGISAGGVCFEAVSGPFAVHYVALTSLPKSFRQ